MTNLGGRAASGSSGNGRPFRPYFPGGRVVRALVAEEFRAAMTPPAREEPPPPAGPPPGRCDNCGYLTTAIGHQITCEDKENAGG